MRCSNRKLLIVFEGSAQRERTIVLSLFHTANIDCNEFLMRKYFQDNMHFC